MNDSKATPKIFANRMIRLLVDHSLGEDTIMGADDYMVIRVAFRNMGGTWEAISLGHPDAINMLKQVVQAWSKDPKQKNKVEVFI